MPLAGWLFHTGLVSALTVAATLPLLALGAGVGIPAVPFTSLCLLLWAMYLLDRLRAPPEDAGTDAGAFVAAHHGRLRVLLGVLLAVQAPLVAVRPGLLAAIALTLALSAGYVAPVPLLGRRVKEIPYAKGFYLTAVSLGIATAFLAVEGLPTFTPAAALAPALLLFVNFTLYDLKDLASDRAAGIRTIAGALPRPVFAALHGTLLAAMTLAATSLPAPVLLALAAYAALYGVAVVVLSRRPFGTVVGATIDGLHGAIVLALIVGAA